MKKILCVVTSFVLILSLLCGCSGVLKTHDEYFALDTVIVFDLQLNSSDNRVLDEELKIIDKYETMLSATKEDSDIYKINHSKGQKIRVSEETAELIKEALSISELTDGAFDIAVYELVKLWGFDTKQYRVPNEKEIQKALDNSGYKNISITDDNVVTVKNLATLDLGGIAKGYIADKVTHSLSEDKEKVSAALVNFGGMITTVSKNNFRDDGSWVIGVEYPDSDNEYFATFKGGYATTSGAYQRYFEKDGKRYHHIIDPKTGKPCESDISSVTITNACSSYTDAMSTAFYVMGVDKTIDFIKEHKYKDKEPYSIIMLSRDKKDVYITQDLLDKEFCLEDKYADSIEIHIIKN